MTAKSHPVPPRQSGPGRVVSLKGIVKVFSGNEVLRGVDFDLRPGEVHALAGANGSGKSTLMKIIYGVHQPTSGQLRLDGRTTRLPSPRHALGLGIAAVPQELPLVGSLTVAENVVFGDLPRRAGLVNWAAVRRRAAAALGQIDVEDRIDLQRPVGTLDLASQQLVSIARTLAHGASILIFDEPTSSLDASAAQRLFATIRSLRDDGCSIGFISQRLDDIFAVADRVAVLRDGAMVADLPLREITRDRVAELMAGHAITPAVPHRSGDREPGFLVVEDLSAGRVANEVSFTVAAGEVVGLAGLPGSGTDDVLRAVAGLLPVTSGRISLGGREIHRLSLPRRVANGMAYVSGDRKAEGLAAAQTVEMNLTMGIHRGARLRPRRPARERQEVGDLIGRLRLLPPDPSAVVGTLSGGNQQKVVIGRWLLTAPRLWLLNDPTRGVDIHARNDIHALIRAQIERTGSAAVLFTSSDLQELLEFCDRILVVRRGRIVAEVDPTASAEHDLLVLAAGGASGEAHAVHREETRTVSPLGES